MWRVTFWRVAGAGSWPVGARVGLPDWVPPLLRIDYVWHSDDFGAMSAATGPVLGSDHIAVMVTLALTGESLDGE